jgi:prepilin-type N-terminal cleavage/methylation domain-containing protein
MQKGFTLLEILIVLATLCVLAAITAPLMKSAMLRAQIGAMAAEAKSIHWAFKRHFVDVNKYPNASTSPAFQVNSFEPLVSMGYYDGRVLGKLIGDQADAYDSPDDQGENQEFWVEMTLKYDPSIRFLVADSDDAPLSGGEYYDGIYMFHNGVLHPISAPVE